MSQRGELARLITSFHSAFSGIVHAFITEKNMRIHGWMAIMVSALSYWSQIPWGQYLILLFAILWVWVMELVNTSLEKTLDLISKEHHPLIKTAKDAAAGAVFLSAGFSVVVGITILYQPLQIKVSDFHQSFLMLNFNEPRLFWFMIIFFATGLGMLITLHMKKRRVNWLTVLLILLSFLGFYWSSFPVFEMLFLLLPIFGILFLRRGQEIILGILELLVSASATVLLHIWLVNH